MTVNTVHVTQLADVARSVVLHIYPPAPVVTLNHRLHWRAESRAKEAWRERAKFVARKVRPQLMPLDPEVRWQCEVSYPTTQPNRRRDPHNWIRTTKWIIDGIVAAGLLVDDDGPHLEVVDASFHSATIMNPCVVVALTRPEADRG